MSKLLPPDGVKGRLLAGTVLVLVALGPLAYLMLLADEGASTEKLREFAQRVELQRLLGTSILLGLVTTLIAVAIGLPLALLLELRRFPGRDLLASLTFVPLLVPPHIHAIAWTRVIGDRGWLTGALRDTPFAMNVRGPMVEDPSIPILPDIYLGPAWIMGCALFPLVTLTVQSGLRQLDGAGLIAARQLGGVKAMMRGVVLPQIAPRVVTGAVFVFLMAISTYPVVSLLDTPVLIQKVFATFQKVDQSAGALLAAPLALLALLCVVALGLFERPASRRGGGREPIPQQAGDWKTTLKALGLLLLASGIPMISLLIVAGPISLQPGVPDNYQSIVARVDVAILDSLKMTGLGVAALLLLGYPVARVLARRATPWLEILALSSLALPPVVIGVSAILGWTHLGQGKVPLGFLAAAASAIALVTLLGGRRRRELPGAALWTLVGIGALALVLGPVFSGAATIAREGLFLVVFAYLARFLPFIVRLLRNGFAALDPEEMEAARLCGHTGFTRFWRIELPRMAPVVSAAAVMAYVLCLTELAATLMTIPPGMQSVQIRIFNMIHYRAVGEVTALCVMTTLFAALPVVLLGTLSRRKVNVW